MDRDMRSSMQRNPWAEQQGTSSSSTSESSLEERSPGQHKRKKKRQKKESEIRKCSEMMRMLEEKKDAVMSMVADLDKARAELLAQQNHQFPGSRYQGGGWNVAELEVVPHMAGYLHQGSYGNIQGSNHGGPFPTNSIGPRPMILAPYGGVQVKGVRFCLPNER